ARERDAVAVASARRDTVIAVGGGAILDAGNLARLRAAGAIVWLTADADTILHRAGDVSRRPLLAGSDPRATIEQLLAERGPAYAAAADVMIDTSGRSVDDVVDHVYERLGDLERNDRWKSST